MASTGFIWNIMTSESIVPVQTNRHLDTMPWSSGKTSLQQPAIFVLWCHETLQKLILLIVYCIPADTRDNRETIEKLAHLNQDQQNIYNSVCLSPYFVTVFCKNAFTRLKFWNYLTFRLKEIITPRLYQYISMVQSKRELRQIHNFFSFIVDLI